MAKKVVLLENVQASPDGIRVRWYQSGEEYFVDTIDMPLSLAKLLVEDLKVAKAVASADDIPDEIEAAPAPKIKPIQAGPAGPQEVK